MTTSEERIQKHREMVAKGRAVRRKINLMQQAGYSNADIAEKLQIPESTVRRVIYPRAKPQKS